MPRDEIVQLIAAGLAADDASLSLDWRTLQAERILQVHERSYLCPRCGEPTDWKPRQLVSERG